MNWLSNPVVWLVLLPALVASGLLYQMVMGLFSCCGTFRIRGREVRLKWWMIPAGATTAAVLWILVIALIIYTNISI